MAATLYVNPPNTMLQTLTTAAATLLILLACHYLYRASPQQHWPGAPPDPARARRLAWRYALAALLLNTLALSSGLILYLPSLAANFLALRTDKSRRRSWLDSHNLLGITSLPFHLIIAATTVVFAFHDLIYDGMDTLLPEAQRMGGHAPARPGGEPVPPDLTRLKLPEELQTLAQKHRADYRADSITYRNLDRPALASAYQHGSVGGMRSAIHIANPYDGRERYTNLATDPYTTISDSYFHLHFGDYGGSIVRAAYFLLGIMGAALFYTGNLLWLDKRPPRRDKTAATLPAPARAHTSWPRSLSASAGAASPASPPPSSPRAGCTRCRSPRKPPSPPLTTPPSSPPSPTANGKARAAARCRSSA